MEQDNKQQLFTVKQIRCEGKEIYVQAFSYINAKSWFEENIMKPGIPMDEIQAEIGEDDKICVVKVNTVAEPQPVLYLDETDTLKNSFTKGYDYDSGSYVFTLLDVYKGEIPVKAGSLEEVHQMIVEGQITVDAQLPMTRSRQVYSCSDEERMVIDGDIIDIHDTDDLGAELRRQYPEGMTVLLEDESVSNLLRYETSDEDEEWVVVKGMIDAGLDTRMAGANGKLAATLVLNPDDYILLDACDQTYYSDELSEWGLDVGMNATSVMLSTEEELKEARIQACINPALLECLHIEGRPYKEIMEMIHNYNIKDDDSLLYLMDMEVIEKQPDWLQKMAKETVQGDMQKFWVEKIGPAYRDERKMYNGTLEQAVRENGYASLDEYKKEVEDCVGMTPEQIEKMERIQKRWLELFQPYRDKSVAVTETKNQLEASLMKSFIIRFNSKAKEVISEIRAIQRGHSDWAVRCKLDGVQQSGKMMEREDADKLFLSNDKTGALKQAATKYFRNEIANAMQQTQTRSMKR